MSILQRLRLLAAAAGLALLATAAGAQPAALQGLRLVDQAGAPVRPASLQRRVVLMNFVFTGCSTSCPLQVRELAEMHAALPAATRACVDFLSVSVDPMNDTPATMAAFARRMGAERPGWRFATGEPAQVEQLLERMRIFDPRAAQRSPADHRTALYLFNGQGELVQRFGGVPVDRARLAREITQLVAMPAPGALRVPTSNRKP